MTFHGSWDRTDPAGYVLSSVRFDGAAGEPVAPPDSTRAAADVLGNADLSRCPDGCFRPVGLAWDARGRLFMSSDSTGEVYVLQEVEFSVSGGGGDSTGTGAGTPTGTGTWIGTWIGTASGTGTPVASTSTGASTSTSTSKVSLAARSSRNRPGGEAIWLTSLAVALSLVCGVFFARA